MISSPVSFDSNDFIVWVERQSDFCVSRLDKSSFASLLGVCVTSGLGVNRAARVRYQIHKFGCDGVLVEEAKSHLVAIGDGICARLAQGPRSERPRLVSDHPLVAGFAGLLNSYLMFLNRCDGSDGTPHFSSMGSLRRFRRLRPCILPASSSKRFSHFAAACSARAPFPSVRSAVGRLETVWDCEVDGEGEWTDERNLSSHSSLGVQGAKSREYACDLVRGEVQKSHALCVRNPGSCSDPEVTFHLASGIIARAWRNSHVGGRKLSSHSALGVQGAKSRDDACNLVLGEVPKSHALCVRNPGSCFDSGAISSATMSRLLLESV